MHTRKLSLTILSLCCYATTAHAIGATGTIRFQGRILPSASASSVSEGIMRYAVIDQTQIDAVSHARKEMHSSVLDFFASYAAKDAKLVSVSYR